MICRPRRLSILECTFTRWRAHSLVGHIGNDGISILDAHHTGFVGCPLNGGVDREPGTLARAQRSALASALEAGTLDLRPCSRNESDAPAISQSLPPMGPA